MLARIEVVVRPDLNDPDAKNLVRQVELSRPDIRKQIRWARLIQVYWLDLPLSREAVMVQVQQLFWDPVTQWLFTGNLIPAAAGKSGGIPDIMEASPIRPGKFWALEKRYRPGVLDSTAKEIHQAFEVLGRAPIPEARVATGQLLLLEGADLTEDSLAWIAKEAFCNERIETWSLFDDQELRKNSRFDQERVRRDLPKGAWGDASVVSVDAPGASAGLSQTLSTRSKLRQHVGLAPTSGVSELLAKQGWIELGDLSLADFKKLANVRKWDFSQGEIAVIHDYFTGRARDDLSRAHASLQAATETELEWLAGVWAEPVRHALFQATIDYQDLAAGPEPAGHAMPKRVDGLMRSMIAGTTEQLPKSWLISVPGVGMPRSHQSGDGIIALDDELALVFGVQSVQQELLLDANHASESALVDLHRRLVTEGFGSRLLFSGGAFTLPGQTQSLSAEPLRTETKISAPTRRILNGIRQGLSRATSRSGVPYLNGSVQWAELNGARPDGNAMPPVLSLMSGGLMPKRLGDRRCETPEVLPGERILVVGAFTGKDGLGSSDAVVSAHAPAPLSDTGLHKKLCDFLVAIRELGVHRFATSVDRGGIGFAVARLGDITQGVRIDLSAVHARSRGMTASELLMSETRDRILLVVPEERLAALHQVLKLYELPASLIGELNESGKFEATFGGKTVVSVDLRFALEGAPQLHFQASWKGRPAAQLMSDIGYEREWSATLLGLLARPAISSKEWLIRQLDHEVQGLSVVKPLHTVGSGTLSSQSGPNDGAVVQWSASHTGSLAVSTGAQLRYQSFDPWLMAQLSVDEAVRNNLCVGAEYGRPESILAISSHFTGVFQALKESPSPELLGGLLRACQGLQDAAIGLGIPIIAHQDSFYSGSAEARSGATSFFQLMVHAVSRVPDLRFARTSDFKNVGDVVYIIGGFERFGLRGGELEAYWDGKIPDRESCTRAPHPDWALARLVYGWIGGDFGDRQTRLKSLHDISEGGLFVALAESMFARNLGAVIQIPVDADPWSFSFGEGFHTFIASCADADAIPIEDELRANRIPFLRLGALNASGRFDLRQGDRKMGAVEVARLRSAWVREGFWE
jgi:phosphoribosylformylglycinamidine (FGAM) synthase-like enzyme/phosphoribosylformylglycinamidine (FGAM) synthase PurS component